MCHYNEKRNHEQCLIMLQSAQWTLQLSGCGAVGMRHGAERGLLAHLNEAAQFASTNLKTPVAQAVC